MKKESRILFVICVISALIIISAGCTGAKPLAGGTYISDDNATHQQWMNQHKENLEKYVSNPENPLEWTLKGMACVASGGDYEGALEYYDTAIGLDPEFAHAYYEKGFSLLNLERYDEAEECLQKATELNPDYEPLADSLRNQYTGN